MNKTITKVFCLITLAAFLLAPVMSFAVQLAATDVTVTVTGRMKSTENQKRINYVTIVFGNGVKTVPITGIPLPSYKKFGMNQQLDQLIFTDTQSVSSVGITKTDIKWDKVNKVLWLYDPAGTTGYTKICSPATTAINTNTVYGIAIGQ